MMHGVVLRISDSEVHTYYVARLRGRQLNTVYCLSLSISVPMLTRPPRAWPHSVNDGE
jgi:hypothetical protein